MYTDIIYSPGDITHITINRDSKRNALSINTVKELTHAFSEAATTSAKVIVLSGAGDKAFCAGADLEELAACTTYEAREQFFGNVAKLITAIRATPQIVIASVQGFALAGGAGLAAASDIVVAGKGAQFGLPEVHLGIAPMVVLTPILQATSQKKLFDWIVSGERWNAETAHAAGLVTHLVEDTAVSTKVNDIASTLCTRSGAALRTIKSGMYELPEASFSGALNLATTRVATLAGSEEAQGLIKAFLTKSK